MALRRLTICACLILSTVCRAADCASKRPVSALVLPKILLRDLPFSVTGSVTVTPSTITFSSPDPDTTPVSGNTTATVRWSMNGGATAWSLRVNASGSSFASCPSVPMSAIKFTCSSATPGGGSTPNATCSSGTFTLSTSPQTIASGTREGNGSAPFTVVVAFTFTDAWNYPASSSCTLSLTYTATG